MQQNRDGGWGLHIEGPSTMFGSVLTYVTLRLLGEGANDGNGSMEKGRDWILNHGGATAITSWGKMWLSVQTRPLYCFSCGLLLVHYTQCMLIFIPLRFRYLGSLNGLETIHCLLRYGFFPTFFQSIQVKYYFVTIAPPPPTC